MRKFLITGGMGFIGSALVRKIIEYGEGEVLNVDKLTYAANPASLYDLQHHPRYAFVRADIGDRAALDALFTAYRPDVVVHLAAESHVDRSIDNAQGFVQTNVVGTYTLLAAANAYWQHLAAGKQQDFRFHHVSTDEVFGDLGQTAPPADECSPYVPSNPYSASKAAADHLVRAWQRTYGLPVVVSHSANNYGPYHYPEKLIPLCIVRALSGRPLPIYGDGSQIRDWLFVEDHVRALYAVATRGRVGENYCIGGHNQRKNIEVVRAICALLEECAPYKPAGLRQYQDLITLVPDRPGHDVRYALDSSKIRRELGWQPQVAFTDGLRQTVQWYADNRSWWQSRLQAFAAA